MIAHLGGKLRRLGNLDQSRVPGREAAARESKQVLSPVLILSLGPVEQAHARC
jgi:hypothetical protein